MLPDPKKTLDFITFCTAAAAAELLLGPHHGGTAATAAAGWCGVGWTCGEVACMRD